MSHKSANLDLLRAIAVSFVVASHLPHYAQVPVPAWYDQNVLGRFGVAMFFVHTVLVLMQSLHERRESAGQFFLRRAFRIYPLSIAVVLITAGLFAAGGRAMDAGTLASNLLLVQNITGHRAYPSPLWTLPYEVQMYLVLPLLYGVTAMDQPVAKVALLWCAGVLVAALGPSPLVYLPCFLPGVLAFTLRDRPKFLGPWALLAVIALGAAVIPVLVTQGVPEVPMFWAACLVLGVVIPHCREIPAGRIAAVAGVVATYSYGVYITHVYAMSMAFPDLKAGPAEWASCAVLLVALSWVAYRLIEQPGIRLGQRLADRLQKRQKRPAEAGQSLVKG
jgi:peptidoglycan/LPS O-acetylase OafA/YrhL